MKENYDKAFELVIGHEGGLSMDRRDRGNWTTGKIGRGKLNGTKYGVSAMSYPHLDIKNLTLDDAKAIYKEDYWDAVKADALPTGLDYLIFDIAINHGVRDGAVFLQEGIGAKVDGAIGPRTLRRATSRPVEESIKAVSTVRAVDYSKIKTVNIYGKGWYRRLVDTTVTAIDMARGPLDQSKEAVVEAVSEASNGRFALSQLFRRTSHA